MTCFYPVKGYRHPDGKVKFAAHGGIHRPVEVACGQCVGCKLRRSCDWAVRCLHESQMHEASCFITLTYDNEKMQRLSLEYKDFQDFMKRLRKKMSFFDVTLWQWSPRFYMCGEYGERTYRPHFHLLLFGVHFPDRVYYGKSPSGSALYTSKLLSDLWQNGQAWIGHVTVESAAYVARYCMKKITGSRADSHYMALGVIAGNADVYTGEIQPLEPEFTSMSLKPGIGAKWYAKFGAEVRTRDGVIIEGTKRTTPRYYDELLKRMDAVNFEDVAYRRMTKADKHFDDNSPARLLVREAVVKARLSFKSRSFE